MDVVVDKCTDMYIDMCTDTCIAMCMHMHIEIRIGMCMDMCTDICQRQVVEPCLGVVQPLLGFGNTVMAPYSYGAYRLWPMPRCRAAAPRLRRA